MSNQHVLNIDPMLLLEMLSTAQEQERTPAREPATGKGLAADARAAQARMDRGEFTELEVRLQHAALHAGMQLRAAGYSMAEIRAIGQLCADAATNVLSKIDNQAEGEAAADVSYAGDVLAQALRYRSEERSGSQLLQHVWPGLGPSPLTAQAEAAPASKLGWLAEGLAPVYAFSHQPDSVVAERVVEITTRLLDELSEVLHDRPLALVASALADATLLRVVNTAELQPQQIHEFERLRSSLREAAAERFSITPESWEEVVR